MSAFSQVKGQEESRRPETFIDQHGREYFAEVELKTGDPCQILQPQGWTAPSAPSWFVGKLLPPLDDRTIIKMVPRLARGRRRYDIEIDYDAWLAVLDQRQDEWETKVNDYVKSMTKGLGAVEAMRDPPPEVLRLAGPPPFPPRVFIEAMKAGNPWALGLDAKIPARAEGLLKELEYLIKKTRPANRGTAIADPLGDDDAHEEEEREELPPSADPLNDLDDLLDPDATGGTRIPVTRPPRGGKGNGHGEPPKQKASARKAATVPDEI